MPDYIREALTERNLLEAYHVRPAYQQNDYIGWITRAKREETNKNAYRKCWKSLKAAGCI
jgi:hypothetical protein